MISINPLLLGVLFHIARALQSAVHSRRCNITKHTGKSMCVYLLEVG